MEMTRKKEHKKKKNSSEHLNILKVPYYEKFISPMFSNNKMCL